MLDFLQRHFELQYKARVVEEAAGLEDDLESLSGPMYTQFMRDLLKRVESVSQAYL